VALIAIANFMDRKVVPIKSSQVVSEVGGTVDEFRVTLAIYGDELDPAAITLLFGKQPTGSHRRGERKTPGSPPFPSGAWLLTHEAIAPITPDAAVTALLTSLPQDGAFWLGLQSQYTVQLRIGVHTAGWNRGFGFAASTAALIANTRASVEFDLYIGGRAG
jgi:hypothetical protein